MQTERDTPDRTKAAQACEIIDKLVAALGGDPASPMRRAVLLCDIDLHPGTTQSDILVRLPQTQLDLNKSALTRDIEWLYDRGCIIRQQSFSDARISELSTLGYAKKNLEIALSYFPDRHFGLIHFLLAYINVFHQEKPTLRDAKIVAALATEDGQDMSRQDVLDRLYDGPLSTDLRALGHLVETGMIEKNDGQ